jgi:hypothetical protein
MQTDPTAYHSLIGSLAALLRSHGAAPTGLRGRRGRCRSVTMSRVILPEAGQGRTGADSSSDSNTGGSRRPTTGGGGGGVQVRNAYERR